MKLMQRFNKLKLSQEQIQQTYENYFQRIESQQTNVVNEIFSIDIHCACLSYRLILKIKQMEKEYFLHKYILSV